MQRQHKHSMLPDANHDERARQAFAQSLKLHLATKVVQGNRAIYDRRIAQAFKKTMGHMPRNRSEVAANMEAEPFYQLWGSLQRSSQEICWSAVNDAIARQRQDLAQRVPPLTTALGSLTLDPDVQVPQYLTAMDIHCMPGGYAYEAFEGDVGAGALYDRGGYIYAMGGWGPDNGAMGRTVCGFLKKQFADLNPQRILDLGCGVGHGTLPYAEAFPEADIHGVDVAAPMLRYAYGRANAMDCAIHFRQANAETMPFADGSFDLIVSHILLHETSAKALPRIMAESYRLLRPGGVTMHVDLSLYQDMDPFNAFMLDWDTRHNNEPFWSTFRQSDPHALLAAAGFSSDDVLVGTISRSATAGHVFSETRDSGGRKNWQLIGARKHVAAAP